MVMRGNKAKATRDRRVRDVIAKIPQETQQIDDIAEIRNWFRPENNSECFPLIQSYLSEISDPQNILEKLRFTILAAHAAGGWWIPQDFWLSIVHSAKRIPYTDTIQHEKLLSIIRILKPIPDWETIPEEDPRYLVHVALPDFGMWVSESLNDAPGCGSGYFTPEIHAWTNLNHFFAIATQEGVADCWLFFIVAVEDGLEKFIRGDRSCEAHAPGTGEEKYAAWVPAVAAWIFAIGKFIYDGGDALGYPKERWAFWKRRFGEIAVFGHLREETRRVAREAVVAMEKIENEDGSDRGTI